MATKFAVQKKKMYKMFMGSDPGQVDNLIDEFLKDGREKVEVRHYGSFNQIQQDVPSIPGLKLPPGAVQVAIQCMFYDVLIYYPNAKDLTEAPQETKLNLIKG